MRSGVLVLILLLFRARAERPKDAYASSNIDEGLEHVSEASSEVVHNHRDSHMDKDVREHLNQRAQPQADDEAFSAMERIEALRANSQVRVDSAGWVHHVWPLDGWKQNVAQIAKNSDGVGQALQATASNGAKIATNAQNSAAVGNMALFNMQTGATNAANIGVLGGKVAANSASITGLVSSVGMLSGSVATNSAAIAGLSAQVAVLGQAAGPTIGLANALGLSVSTVASLSLAGSFMAPVLGVIMLVYVCWPEPRNDPWWQMEARVAKMINDRFNEERRTTLTNRLKRYVAEFSRCSTAWIECQMKEPGWFEPMAPAFESETGFGQTAMAQPFRSTETEVEKHREHWSTSLLEQSANASERSAAAAAQVTTFMNLAMNHLTGKELMLHTSPSLFDIDSFTPRGSGVPRCMEQLEMHMSLERDQWMSTEEDSLDGLFMPFANLHTQVQSILSDYDSLAHQKWYTTSQSSAAEYATFILKHIISSWKSQVCRTVRLRYARTRLLKWEYRFVVLSPLWQPHAGEDCWEKCGAKSGWCNYCGGVDVGACCARGAAFENPPGDPSECRQFDVPTNGWLLKSSTHTCVHTGCHQTDSLYDGKVLDGSVLADVQNWTACQEHCTAYNTRKPLFDAKTKVVFNLKDDKTCECLLGGPKRKYEKGAISGPTVCEEGGHEVDTQKEEDKEENIGVPVEESDPCDHSPAVRNLDELERDHGDWFKQCYAQFSVKVLEQFNPFFVRFADFIDQLAWRAGCTAHPDSDAPDDFYAVSDDYDHSTWGECDWDRERKHGDNAQWTPDPDRKKGMFGQDRIDVDEQKKVKMRYPLPMWLRTRQTMLNCLEKVASGGDADDTTFGSAEGDIFKAVEVNTKKKPVNLDKSAKRKKTSKVEAEAANDM